MGYRELLPQEKLAAVKEAWSLRRGIAGVARKYNVSRPSLYHWLKLADEVLLEALNERPGRKPKPSMEKLQAQVDLLQRQLVEVLEGSHDSTISVAISPHQSGPRPASCPSCGSSRIWRYGSWPTKREGARQRFICADCRQSLYLTLKKTLPSAGP